MPSTGTSKKITVTMDVDEPAYLFLDYDYSKTRLSQRVEITPEQKSSEVTLMPGSQTIQVEVIPQKAVSEYLNFMEHFNYERRKKEKAQDAKGFVIIEPMVLHKPNYSDDEYQKLQRQTKRVANIFYDKVHAGETVELPNPL